MFDHMFDMIAESAEVALAQEEYRKALEGLRAQVLTTPEDGTPKEQETWAEEWHRRVVRGPRLGRAHANASTAMIDSIPGMHGVCVTWRAEVAQRVEEEKQRVAREREEAAAEAEARVREAVHARQEEMARERERAAEEVGMDEPVDEEDKENEEAGEEGASAAMVVSPVATPTKKAKTHDPRLTVVVPPHKFTEAFHKGGKDFKPKGPLEGNEVTAATAREESKGRPQRVVGNLVRRGVERCEACMDKQRKVCWGEDKRVCRRCQMKWVGCSKSTKALREREMSEHSGVSKGKAKAINRPGELEQGVSGPSTASTSAHPWPYPVPMPSVSRDVVEANLLPEDGPSVITNQKLNALVRILGRLITQGSFIKAQVQNLKARAMDLSVEVQDVQETHGKYSHQLEYAAAQLGAVLHEAKEFPVEEEEESSQEDSE
ncbi:hypothetical protein PAXINDRAFT_18112 [Paxillus involutus ATCC 200175]|uniref:Uncharacterized protein n=1 Tax=Paxillus involutus ATCC 200175 TaxID=664439 RepID=A0A0C9TLX0_PAXIN|nr:hypothetical protein PAXINDRAFT_18112 [Paxillus involutus ATCC 200175]